jgi:HNH/ENDO VII superfamily nuclease with conserved GHE residues
LGDEFNGFNVADTFSTSQQIPNSASGNSRAWLSGINAALTVGSLAPGPIGSIASAAQAGLDLVQGHYFEAGIDAAAIALSFVGLGVAAKAIKLAHEARLAKNAESLAVDAAKVGASTTRLTDAQKVLYSRVTHRKGLRDQVWNSVSQNGTREVYDPSGRIIQKTDTWDLGHLPEHKFSDAQLRAAEEDWTRQQWIEYQNDPAIYRPELPRNNQAHEFEGEFDRWWDSR